MIKLLGIIARGGVPIRIRTFMRLESKELIGGMLEAVKALSCAIGSKEVRMLDFGENKLIITESKKGYTIVALAEKAEEYIEELIKIIASDIDNSDIEEASGIVCGDLTHKIDNIIDTYIDERLDVDLTKIMLDACEPLISYFEKTERYKKIIKSFQHEIDETPDEKWGHFVDSVSGSFSDALDMALRGDFDHACAISIKIEDKIAKIFAIKMGLLALSMTNTIAPRIEELKSIAEKIKSDDPWSVLVKHAVRYRTGEITIIEYLDVYKRVMEKFEFADDNQSLAIAFLFVESTIGRFPEFAEKMAEYFKDKSEVIYTYIQTILERNRIFSKLYSITSFDEFKEDLSVWKAKISDILKKLDKMLRPSLLARIFGFRPRGADINILGITHSLQLQTYIALLTALAESPVLPLNDRHKILTEIINLYDRYMQKLLHSDIALFSSTIMNTFQSISVVLNELSYFVTIKNLDKHLARINSFLEDILWITLREWIKKKSDISLITVITNALCPILAKKNVIYESEVKLLYLLSKLLDIRGISASKLIRPYGYAVIVGNLINTLSSFVHRIEDKKTKSKISNECIRGLLGIHRWFLSQGVICRDDILTMTYNIWKLMDLADDSSLENITKAVIAFNKIAVPGTKKYEYETAILAENLIGFLLRAWRILNNEEYLNIAREIYNRAIEIWLKYGFKEKAQELRNKYKIIIT